ncbi:tripartite-type tricarboxylate transporter receptor subunit TctC [Variovorax boronicumulans]|uniref:Tripartite-type tricarboxylate transporter receptor subunit TctC n=1 Tax=Variovorax boronicumulans TaxID=436515 RepID=A0AAW8DU57_9BURK|nr:tripartite tricarboxylate transporter substrate binding protein [Variovorax boronicumulans]MDP9877703.1 tripartite-type tricarboxylate transporter receptor subunit TctC [Variovorax boronicumulans]MDP9922987.1 tripartite-type tricarboxylate transporter receptor subunit TctC [Variovorax boronicumulans]
MKLIKGLLLAAAFVGQIALAQGAGDYPGKPVRLVVPFGAGSASDTVARIVAEEVRARMGVVVVDNKQGANGIIGTGSVAKAAPDGYTLVLTSSSTHSGIGALFKQPGYDPLKDFVHIGRIATIPMVLVARPDAPFRTAQELAAQARQSPLRYAYGSGSAQIAGATFSSVANAPSDAIPYKSQPPAITDLLGGQVDCVLADASVVTSFLRAGHLRGLAITSLQRAKDLPEVPTMAQAGCPGFDLVVWVGLAAPAGTPEPIVALWNKKLASALSKPEVSAKLARLGMVASPNTPQQQAEFALAQRDIWVTRSARAGIQAE